MANERDKFLDRCRTEETAVVIFTTNGFQLRGVILSFDGEVIIFRREDGRAAMIYQRAISTILAE